MSRLLLLVALITAAPLSVGADDVNQIAPAKSWFGFGSIPYLGPQGTAEAMASVKEAMEFVLKTRVRFGTSFDVDGFQRRIERGQDDFIFVFPTEYQLAVDSGYVPLARLEAPLRAFIVVPVASQIRSTADLRDKLLMVPGYGSPVGDLARKAVEDVGLRWNRDVITLAMRNDGVCLREMLRGLADACAAFQAPNKVIQQQLGIKLRSVGQSPGLPGPFFAGHRRVSIENREKIRKMLISLDDTTSGRFRLRKAGLGSIIDINPSDYAPRNPPSDNPQ